MGNFHLKCQHPDCGATYEGGKGFRLRCDNELSGGHGPAFLLPVYEQRQIAVRTDLPGIFKYLDWLPVGPYFLRSDSHALGEPFCYKSAGLARRLGLSNLYIAFSGFWPERGANLLTRTFKEFEVQCSILHYLMNHLETGAPPFIIASAGNTANSFSLYCHLLGLPLYLFVPESGLDNLLLPFPTRPFVIAVKGDYTDAIALADQVASELALVRDGGAFNVGRRSGMATMMLNAVAHPEHGTGETFQHYFQGVGSGSGAIAAWEAVQMLLADGRFGDTVTRIHMAQNAPFAPIPDAWDAGRGVLVDAPEQEMRDNIDAVTATVLTNRRPPYAVAGGLHDVLSRSNGRAWRVGNHSLFIAARTFRSLEGVDIGPAAAVAVDSLVQAVEAGEVGGSDRVLLHITGGGRELQYAQGEVDGIKPTLVAGPGDADRVVAAIGRPKHISPTRIREVLRRINGATGT